MTRKKTPRQKKLLTEVELELMGILWRLGEGTVSDVAQGLPAERKLAYTSVSTILRILEQKKLSRAEKKAAGISTFLFSQKKNTRRRASSIWSGKCLMARLRHSSAAYSRIPTFPRRNWPQSER